MPLNPSSVFRRPSHGSDGTAQFTCGGVAVVEKRHVEAGQMRHVSPGAAQHDNMESDERDGRDRDAEAQLGHGFIFAKNAPMNAEVPPPVAYIMASAKSMLNRKETARPTNMITGTVDAPIKAPMMILFTLDHRFDYVFAELDRGVPNFVIGD